MTKADSLPAGCPTTPRMKKCCVSGEGTLSNFQNPKVPPTGGRIYRTNAAGVAEQIVFVNLTVKRRYLTEREVERLMNRARKHGRYGHRDATMILDFPGAPA
jgi:hypothetical protein